MTFYPDRGPNSGYIDNQPLYIHHMILIKVLRPNRGLSDQKVALRPQKPPELSETPKITTQHHLLLWQRTRKLLHLYSITLFLFGAPK